MAFELRLNGNTLKVSLDFTDEGDATVTDCMLVGNVATKLDSSTLHPGTTARSTLSVANAGSDNNQVGSLLLPGGSTVKLVDVNGDNVNTAGSSAANMEAVCTHKDGEGVTVKIADNSRLLSDVNHGSYYSDAVA